MGIDEVLDKLDLTAATALELNMRNRLMPPRWDRLALLPQAEMVARWLRPRYLRGLFGERAELVFVQKNRSGVRPISELTLADGVLYRALVALIGKALPHELTLRSSNAEFQQAPLHDGVKYVSKTDVSAYYEFIDHEVLEVELLSQTGEAPAIEALLELLSRVMGRRVGLPQIHAASDVLGDTYIDPVRRRMRRAGHEIYTYSDDFRFANTTLAGARTALETCAAEVRVLGLVLNESKTFTYGVQKYGESLIAFSEAERRLFDDHDDELAFLMDEGYADPDDGQEGEESAPGEGADVIASPETEEHDLAVESNLRALDPRQVSAAERAWLLWFDAEKAGATSPQDDAIAVSLLSRALPILGAAGIGDPLKELSRVLRREPSLTPQVARYLISFGKRRIPHESFAQEALEKLVGEESFSTWQRMWLAETAGHIGRPVDGPICEWLATCVASAPAPLAATAAAAVGRLKLAESDTLSSALDRVGPVWRGLVFWGLAQIDLVRALDCADGKLERAIVGSITG